MLFLAAAMDTRLEPVAPHSQSESLDVAQADEAGQCVDGGVDIGDAGCQKATALVEQWNEIVAETGTGAAVGASSDLDHIAAHAAAVGQRGRLSASRLDVAVQRKDVETQEEKDT